MSGDDPGRPPDAGAPDLAYRRLLDRRTVFLRGPLDAAAANQVAAELMALDAEAAEPLTLVVNSGGGALAAVFPVIDTLDLLRVEAATLVVGQALGTAAAVVACGGVGQRRATPSARLGLRLAPESLDGSTTDLLGRARELTAQRDRLLLRLATATGRPAEELGEAFERGPFLGPGDAVALGLLDAVAVGLRPV